MAKVAVTCALCGCVAMKEAGGVNRARRSGLRLFCSRTCAGIGRRVERSAEDRKALKAAYDADRRERLHDRLKAEKAAYHKRTYDPVKAAEQRRARMPRHVEYCRRPEYRKWKAEYDRKHRSQKLYGDFAEVALVLSDLEAEIGTRISRTEVYRQNGTLNKWIQRRREYERQTDRR